MRRRGFLCVLAQWKCDRAERAGGRDARIPVPAGQQRLCGGRFCYQWGDLRMPGAVGSDGVAGAAEPDRHVYQPEIQGAGGGVALAVVVIVCMVFLGGEKTYRSVRVLEYQGQATVTRKGETFSVYDDLVIQGGDGMATGEDGQVDLRLDEDKYLMVESSSQVSFDLEGNTEKGAIRINLQEGAPCSIPLKIPLRKGILMKS